MDDWQIGSFGKQIIDIAISVGDAIDKYNRIANSNGPFASQVQLNQSSKGKGSIKK